LHVGNEESGTLIVWRVQPEHSLNTHVGPSKSPARQRQRPYLKPYFHPGRFVVQTQWTVLPLFLVLFMGGEVLWLGMLKRYPFTAPLKSGAGRPEMR
jgi:hypothetical protein